MHPSARVVIFLGPPGSGKGTQGALLSSALDVPAISTGDMLRQECDSRSKLGQAVRDVLASGQLVSDDLVNQVVHKRLRQPDCKRGCILDGYPRKVSQARYLDQTLAKLDMPGPVVFNFEIAPEAILSRLSRRLQCPQCRRIFSSNENTNGHEPVCDRDGAKLIHRADDNPATVRERLRVYEQNAAELVRYYSRGEYHRIDASRTPAEVSQKILRILNSGGFKKAPARQTQMAAEVRYFGM